MQALKLAHLVQAMSKPCTHAKRNPGRRCNQGLTVHVSRLRRKKKKGGGRGEWGLGSVPACDEPTIQPFQQPRQSRTLLQLRRFAGPSMTPDTPAARNVGGKETTRVGCKTGRGEGGSSAPSPQSKEDRRDGRHTRVRTPCPPRCGAHAPGCARPLRRARPCGRRPSPGAHVHPRVCDRARTSVVDDEMDACNRSVRVVATEV